MLGRRVSAMPRLFPKVFLILCCCPLLASCIVHRAAVSPQNPDEHQVVVSAMGNSVQDKPTSYAQSSALPEEIPATLWLRDSEGNLLRGDVTAQTARPWWQRFPADIITDLLPITFRVEAQAELIAKPLTPMSRDEDQAAADFNKSLEE